MILRGLQDEAVESQLSRREILKRAIALGVSASATAAMLVACGGNSDDDAGSSDDDPVSEATDEQATSLPVGDSATVDDSTAAEPTEPSAESADSDGPTGSITISLQSEPRHLGFWELSTSGHPVILNIYEGLLFRDPETNELVPGLAESWEWVDDLTWHFKLREGVTFHNGEAFNADVAAFGINVSFDPESGELLSRMGSQITATAIDEYLLEIKTEEPDPIIPTRLFFTAFPSKEQMEADPHSPPDHPYGTGPYKFVEWAQGQYIKLTANEEWWGRDGQDPTSVFAIKDVEIQFRPESSVRAAQIETGEAQLANLLTAEDCESLPICVTSPSIVSLILRLDTMHPVMADRRIREAMTLALDLDAVTATIYKGMIPASNIYGPATTGYNADLVPYPYDMERATELVEEAAADGVPVDEPLTIVTRHNVPGDAEFVQYAVEQFKQIGLEVESQYLEDVQFSEEVWGYTREEIDPERGWIALITHGNELMDASQSMNFYLACDKPTHGSAYCNEDINPRIYEAELLAGEERNAFYQELYADIYADVAVVPIAHITDNYGMAENLVWKPRTDTFILIKEMASN